MVALVTSACHASDCLEIFLPRIPSIPLTKKTMKRNSTILLACATPLIIYTIWNPEVLAAMRTQTAPIPGAPAIDYPLGQRCVVTVDPLATSKPVIAGTANKVTGFVAPDTAEGTLIRMDSDWLVLRDGSNEEWIPKNKIIMLHVCH